MPERLLLLVLGVAAGVPLSLAAPAVLRRMGLQRANFQGRPIPTGGGLLFLTAALPWLAAPPAGAAGDALLALALLGFGALGLLDDLRGTPEFRGFRGHLRALRTGRVTTGLVKAAGGAAVALLLAASIRPAPSLLVSAALIALSANAMNLLDLRPLRALKLFWPGAALLLPVSPPLLALLLGLSLPYGRREARRELMLGDTGSNALGAALGLCAALALPLPAQAALAGLLLALHLLAERHSLSAWIERTPWARRLDALGRRDEP